MHSMNTGTLNIVKKMHFTSKSSFADIISPITTLLTHTHYLSGSFFYFHLSFVVSHLSPPFLLPWLSVLSWFPTHKQRLFQIPSPMYGFLPASSLLAVLSLLFHCVYWGLYARDGVGNNSLKILGEFRSNHWLMLPLHPSRTNDWAMMAIDVCASGAV